MSLKAQITEDMKTAMRAKDSARLGTIRLLQAAMKQKEVDERVELDDAMVIAIVDKLIKQRKDSVPPTSAPNVKTWPTSRARRSKCSRCTCPNVCRQTKSPPQ